MALRAQHALRRTQHLITCLARPPTRLKCSSSTTDAEGQYVIIGDVRVPQGKPSHPELVPVGYLEATASSQSALQHLRWLMQKGLLRQDMFLLGPPGPLRRRIALSYCELTKQEVEYLCLSRDTTESDIKQRREIVDGTSHYVNQCAVRAALTGRVLVIEGIEKAERNLLPILNNLLENREGQLDDGRFLVAPKRYDDLLAIHSPAELQAQNLLRVHEDFRVIALGLPVPRFTGNPLDPPLRSRFQARDIRGHSFADEVATLSRVAPELAAKDPELISRLVSHGSTLRLLSDERIESKEQTQLPTLTTDALCFVARTLERFPHLSPSAVLDSVYPYASMLKPSEQDLVTDSLKKFSLQFEDISPTVLNGVDAGSGGSANVTIATSSGPATLRLAAGPFSRSGDVLGGYQAVQSQATVLASMCVSHSEGDICLVGSRGCGKSVVAERFARILGYPVQHIAMHKDLTARDLLQQRFTLSNGNTAWRLSPLTTAAIEGSVAVLDGVHRLDPGTLTVIQRLSQDREITLHDGTRLVGADRYAQLAETAGLDEKEMTARGILQIHPSFRIVALAEPPALDHGPWLTEEIMSMFRFHTVPSMTLQEERDVIAAAVPNLAQDKLDQLLSVTDIIRRESAATVLSNSVSLSTRHLLRIARRLERYGEEDIGRAIQRISLARFLPSLAREALDSILSSAGAFDVSMSDAPVHQAVIKTDEDGSQVLDIGGVTGAIHQQSAGSAMLVPDVVFYDNPAHLSVMREMLKDFELGEHLLLVGNQGVGKNKIVDRLLHLLNRPREYIQLHRDTTVQSLTQQPSVENGRIVFQDSPLVRAVTNGSVLVVDEADKAPTHVSGVLKTLLESGEMTLGDGRRIIRHDDPRPDSSSFLRAHPNFRAIVLANRPGYPFLGNDFFGSMGDVFSCHSVDNPDQNAELEMLKKYAPSVDTDVLTKLSSAFADLRILADEGQISYPYSMRELVSIATHLDRFPDDGVGNVVRSVFDFDSYDHDMRKLAAKLSPSLSLISSGRAQLPPVKHRGTWLVGSRAESCSTRTKALLLQSHVKLPQSTVDGHGSDSRASVFQEEVRQWNIPLMDAGRLTGLAAKDDHIFATTINAPCLYSFTDGDSNITQADLSAFYSAYTSRDQIYVQVVPTSEGDRLFVHSRIEPTMLLVDMDGSNARVVGEGVLKKASRQFVRRLGEYFAQQQHCSTSLASQGIIIKWTDNSHALTCFDFVNNTDKRIQLPLPDQSTIQQVFPISKQAWVVTVSHKDKSTSMHVLRSNDPSALPNELVDLQIENNTELTQIFTGSVPADMVATVARDLTPIAADVATRIIGQPDTIASFATHLPSALLGKGTGDNTHAVEVYGANSKHEGERHVTAMTSLDKMNSVVHARRSATGVGIEVVDWSRAVYRQLMLSPAGVTRVQKRQPQSNYIEAMCEGSAGQLIVGESLGTVRLVEVDQGQINFSLAKWRQMVGSAGGFDGPLRVEYQRDSGLDVTAPKHGKVDADNQPHVGGNTWAGGTGGRDTAGLGGKGGPYRLDAGHDVHQLSQAEKDAVPEDVKQAARELGRKAFEERLREINMSEYDAEVYNRYYDSVAREVKELKVVLASLEAKSDEREWLKNQSIGDLDDHKLIESLTGEQTIYKRRGTKAPSPGGVQEHPKHFRFVLDLSGSMYRFNGHDGRLERMLEAACMIMEAFEGTGKQYQWEIVGHSGESEEVVLVDGTSRPQNEHERLKVLQQMHAHAQYCLTGDHTLDATKLAISKLAARPADERFVVVISDANLDIYGISPQRFGRLLASDASVSAYAIMIGSLGDQATDLTERLPSGRAFVCLNTKDIPKVLKQVFTTALKA